MTLFEQIQKSEIKLTPLGNLPLAIIKPPEDCPPPSRELIAGVKLHKQVIEPLILVRLPKAVMVPGSQHLQTWEIVSGRRRYLAAIECKLPHVPAIELRGVDGVEAALTLGLHGWRKPNVIADIHAAAKLILRACDEKDIRKLTGLSTGTIKKLRGIAASDKRIIQALSEGRCTPNVAEAAAKLLPNRQNALLNEFARRLAADPKAKLTARDVAAVKDAVKASAVSALPADLFEIEMPAAVPQPAISLVETVSGLLAEYGAEAIIQTINNLKTEERKAA